MMPADKTSLQEESMKVLQMIEQGQITAEEGIRLLTAAQTSAPVVTSPVPPEPVETEPVIVPAPVLETAPPHQSAVAVPSKGWFRVRVTDMATNRAKVTVNLPLSLMNAGLKIGAHFAPELKDMNLAEVFTELRATQPGKIIDVLDEEDGEHVEIFVE
jgi:hypothetical protein